MTVTQSNVVIPKVLRLVKFRYNLKLESVGFSDKPGIGYEKEKVKDDIIFTKVEKFVEGTA